MEKRSAKYDMMTSMMSSFILASKKEDSYPVEMYDIVKICDKYVKSKELIECEKDIILTLHGDFNIVNYRNFLNMITLNSDFIRKISGLCIFLGQFVMTYISGKYLPSVIATSIYVLSSYIINKNSNKSFSDLKCEEILDIREYISNDTTFNITNIPSNNIQHCINNILDTLKSKYFTKREILSNVGIDGKKNLVKFDVFMQNAMSIINEPNVNIEIEETFLYRKYGSEIYEILSFISTGEKFHLDENLTCNYYKNKWNPTSIHNMNYTKIKFLGEGVFGSVSKIRCENESAPDNILAVKSITFDEDVSVAFLREISILSIAKHKNIVSLMGINLLNDKGYVFLECMDCDLKTYYNKFDLTQETQLEITKQLCEGLDYLHNLGIIHRDIKPENILMAKTRESIIVKLADFSICRGSGMTSTSNVSSVACTLWYRPPEVLLGGDYDQRIDVWSLGCCIYELATKTPLFPGDSQVDQLYCIFRKCGTPNDDTWPGVSKFSNYDIYFPKWKESTIWPNNSIIHKGFKILVENCLIMNVSSNGSQPKRIYSKDFLHILLEKNNNLDVTENLLISEKALCSVSNDHNSNSITKSQEEEKILSPPPKRFKTDHNPRLVSMDENASNDH
jgi:serine/threonine protein kinase